MRSPGIRSVRSKRNSSPSPSVFAKSALATALAPRRCPNSSSAAVSGATWPRLSHRRAARSRKSSGTAPTSSWLRRIAKRSTHWSRVTSKSMASGPRRVGGTPLAADQKLVGSELRLVGHLAAPVDPVAEVDMGQTELARLLDLPEHVVGAIARLRLGFEEGVDRRQAIVQHVEDRDHLERAVAVLGRLAELDQARVDAALEQELGVLVDRIVVHAAADVAPGLVAQVELVVLGDEAQAKHARLEVVMRAHGAPLAARRHEARDRHAQRQAGTAA